MRFRAGLATIALTGILTILAAYSGISQTTTTPAATTLTVAAAGGPANWSGGYPVLLQASLSPGTVSEGTMTFSVTDQSGNALGQMVTGNGAFALGVASPISGIPVTNGAVKGGWASVMWQIPAGSAAGSYTVTASYNGTANFAASTATGSLTLTDYSAQLPQPLAVPLSYDILYCRAPRDPGGNVPGRIADVTSSGKELTPGTDLMVLHPDGSQEVVVSSANGTAFADSIQDLQISFDATQVYFTRHRFRPNPSVTTNYVYQGADVYVQALAKVGGAYPPPVQLTSGGYAPNRASSDGLTDWPVINSCPCPTADGRIIFTSNRNRYRPNKAYTAYCMQLFRMNPDGTNVEKIGSLNLGSALHPFPLRNGQIAFSSYEAQGVRDVRMWSLWGIDPDGTSWFPLFSQLSTAFVFHFGTQLSDGRIVIESYYNENERGLGSLYALPEPGTPPVQASAVGASVSAPAGADMELGVGTFLFMPLGLEWLTPFCYGTDGSSPPTIRSDPFSPRTGKLTHPAATLNGDMLAVWSPTPVCRTVRPCDDAGIYLVPTGSVTQLTAPNQMVKILNDPRYNELFPVPVLTYQQKMGMATPQVVNDVANNGSLDVRLPEGTPYGLVGTSSLYKREDWPQGKVGTGGSPVTAGPQGAPGQDVFAGVENVYHHYGTSFEDWNYQGAVTGRWQNADIVGIRILALEPSTAGPQTWGNYSNERVRILGEVPVRKFATGTEPLDPDGNPDTSFLVKIPADRPFTWQAITREGFALDMSQTWHQLRPGEVRVNCGGCHAHSQKPTDFSLCAAAKPDYPAWDLTDTSAKGRPLFTSKALDQTGQKWSADDSTGVRFQPGGEVSVDYNRDILPLLTRSCIPCHNGSTQTPPGNLRLDLTTTHGLNLNAASAFPFLNNVPDTYTILAAGKIALQNGWNLPTNQLLAPGSFWEGRMGSAFGARRSLLTWKLFGYRADSWKNSDFPTETTPGVMSTVPITWTFWNGSTSTFASQTQAREWCDIDFDGQQCPPAGAVDASGNPIPPLSEDEKRLFARWIDLGYPIDLSGNGTGYLQDDQPPTVALPYPSQGANTTALTKLIVGLSDTGSGLDLSKFSVTADFAVDGSPAGTELSPLLVNQNDGRFAYTLKTPITSLARGNLTVKAQDKAGNRTSLVRTFAVNATPPPPAPTTTTVAAATVTSAATAQNVTFTATITPTAVSEGTVTFTVTSSSSVVIGAATVSGTVASGQASVSYALPAGIAAGSYTITAAYSGTANFTASSGTATLTVNPAPAVPTTLTIPAVTAVASAINQTINLSATLAPATVNEGTVTFTILSGQTPLGTAVSSAVQNGAASAGFTLPGGTVAGSYTISAAYADTPGSTNFAASTGTAALTVNPQPNPNAATIAALQATIAALQAQDTVLQAQIAALQALVAQLQNPPMLKPAAKSTKAAPKVNPPPYRAKKGKTTPFRPITRAKKGKS